MPDLFLRSAAVLSDCGRYRYRLSRTWDDTLPPVAWIMLNPSTADASADDPTIRRCCGFAQAWGAGGIVVVNLFAARCTDPKKLRQFADPVGPDNDRHVLEAATSGARVLVAWGALTRWRTRAREVLALLRADGVRLECLGLTQGGFPRHPLFVAGAVSPVPFTEEP